MRVLNKSLKVLLLGTTLMTSAKAADLTLTAAEYAALSHTVAVGVPEADKAVAIANVVGSGLDKGYLGTVAASSEYYAFLDGSSKLKALAIIGGKWCTFESGVLGTTSASGQIHLTQTKEDGINATAKKLTINLTKTTGANISAVALGTWLRSALTSANKSFSASALKTLAAPANGWTATALVQLVAGSNLAADAVAATLDPIAFTLTAPVTPAAGGAAVSYTAALSDISAYNVPLSDAYSASVDLTNSSNTLTFALQPGQISSHSTSIMDGLVAGANDLARKRLKTATPYTYPLPSDAASSVLAVIGASSPSGIAEDLAAQHARLATDPSAGSTDTLKETVDVLLGKVSSVATNVQTALVAELARLATDPTDASTDTLKEAIAVILGKISSVATNVQTSLAAELARLATDPTDASTDTLKEAIAVILGKISSVATNVQTALAAEHARLATDPTNASTDTLKEAIAVILAQISSSATNVQTDLAALSATIGASSPSDIAADLAAEHARLATDPAAGSTDTLKKTIDVILWQISPEATNVQTVLGDIVTLLGGSTLKEGLTVVAKGYVDSANFTETDGSHTPDDIDGNKYGAVAFTSHDITGLTNWRAVGNTVEVSGTINGNARTFTCSVSGLEKFLDDVESGTQKKVLEFSSSQGDVFWIKAFNGTGLDASGFLTAGFKDDYLAILIAAKFSTVTSIGKKTLLELRTAAAS